MTDKYTTRAEMYSAVGGAFVALAAVVWGFMSFALDKIDDSRIEDNQALHHRVDQVERRLNAASVPAIPHNSKAEVPAARPLE